MTLLEDFVNVVIYQPVLEIKGIFNYYRTKIFLGRDHFPSSSELCLSTFHMWGKITGREIQLFPTSDSPNHYTNI